MCARRHPQLRHKPLKLLYRVHLQLRDAQWGSSNVPLGTPRLLTDCDIFEYATQCVQMRLGSSPSWRAYRTVRGLGRPLFILFS